MNGAEPVVEPASRAEIPPELGPADPATLVTPAPTRSRLAAMLEATGIIANVAVVAAAFVAGITLIRQHQDARSGTQMAATTNLLSIKYSDDMVVAQRTVSDYLVAHQDEFQRAIDQRQRDHIASLALPAEDVLPSFTKLLTYYNDVLICRESAACDQAAVDRWFGEDICSAVSYAEVSAIPQLQPSFGEKFAKRLTDYRANQC